MQPLDLKCLIMFGSGCKRDTFHSYTKHYICSSKRYSCSVFSRFSSLLKTKDKRREYQTGKASKATWIQDRPDSRLLGFLTTVEAPKSVSLKNTKMSNLKSQMSIFKTQYLIGNVQPHKNRGSHYCTPKSS